MSDKKSPGFFPTASKNDVPVLICVLSSVNKKKTRKTQCFCGFSLARLKGLEPLTYWFVASHSIQLSYKRICFLTA